MDRMSDADREILMLKEIQGLKVEEIALLLKVPTGTVKSRCNRARLDLAERGRRPDPSYGADRGADMTCRTFGGRLGGLLEGRVSPPDDRAAAGPPPSR